MSGAEKRPRGAHMVDVGDKAVTSRRAVARGSVYLPPKTLTALREGNLPKGDVLGVAQTAGIMAAKRTAELLPLCHNLPLDHLSVDLQIADDGVVIEASAAAPGKTGVEMEALTAVAVAALTVYDMCKSAGPGIRITEIELVEKTGGRTDWRL